MPCMNKTSRFWCAQPVDATCHSRDLSHQKHAVIIVRSRKQRMQRPNTHRSFIMRPFSTEIS